MSCEEATKWRNLSTEIFAVIESKDDYTYKEVIQVLDDISKYYKEKGCDLLNKQRIKEVARSEKF